MIARRNNTEGPKSDGSDTLGLTTLLTAKNTLISPDFLV